ncbi:unnamed protein product [Bursaphelenchus xylophilus]|uniref:(pine wood nematode) hypothetical protein n=1 Tax=Bursaphelenchus xylophilus TaxID=6326 RepID=A0A7I8X690_BURXY|nr:unnamed protein product [Bursaphelenchus xylophilus]CAG9123187.1 unnamed protein product [Bursaphelenchus xylophilus]
MEGSLGGREHSKKRDNETPSRRSIQLLLLVLPYSHSSFFLVSVFQTLELNCPPSYRCMTLSFKEGTKRFMVDSLQGRLSRKRKKLKQLAECSSLGNHAGLRANNSSTQFPVVSDRLVICLP